MRFAGKFLLVNLEIQSMRRPLFGYSREITTSMCCLIKIHLLGFKTLLKGVRGEQGSVETSGLVLGADSHPLLHTGRMFQERDLALDLGLQASRTTETPQVGSRLLNNAHINDVNLDGANSSDGGFIPTQILRKTSLGSRWLEDAI